MSNLCNDAYNMCNVIIINISWFVEQLCYDINQVRKDLANEFDNANNQIERPTILKPFRYTDDEKEIYQGDEEWLEPWDRV